MKHLATVSLVSIMMSGIGLTQTVSYAVPHRTPTYYLAVNVVNCDRRTIRVSGASNLPPGSSITTVVTDFDGDGWHDNSDEVFAEIDNGGFFHAEIHSNPSKESHHNSLLRAFFAPYHPKQANDVLKSVGRKGQNLGGLENPQVFQVSGPYFGLETIARVTNCGEGIDGGPARQK
jgi:hypothetical protein